MNSHNDTFKKLLPALMLLFAVSIQAWGANPVIADRGVCDPHLHIFNNRAYLYTGHDTETNKWNMPEWQVWSSADLVDWKL